MNAHQPVSYRDRLNAEDKARKRRLGFNGKPQPLEPKIAPVDRYGLYGDFKPTITTTSQGRVFITPEWMIADFQFDAHVQDYREWMARNLRFYGSPVRQYINRRAAELGLTYDQMIGKGRTREVTEARHLIWWEIKNIVKPDISYPEIGRIFGGRDHTSVLHGIRKIDAERAADVQA